MKNTIILLIIVMLPNIILGQPTIKNAEDFSIGTVLKFQVCNPADIHEGKAGKNQTWDFSKLKAMPDTITEWMLPPLSTTHGSLFPTANQVEKYSDGRFVYVNKTENENYIVGFIDTTKQYPPTKYPDPMMFAKRPLKYGNIITDTFKMVGSSAEGIVTIHADGYGTLILPNGTHKNVLRVKISEVHPWFSFDIYVWFDGIHHSALLKVDSQPNVEYLLSETTNITSN